jgi:N-acyl-D-aspartate/D-glutamate deacylase
MITWLAAFLFFGCGPDYDTIIRNAEVHDGTGAVPLMVDVAIADGRIALIGSLADATARDEIDAAGLILAPGFIDVHSHAAGALATPELAAGESLLRQGITTIFANPDGGGPIDMMAQREALEAASPGVNVAQLIPHGSVRREVMGMTNRHADPSEVQAMERLVSAGMDAGAFGLSSGLFYTPGSFADLSEVVTLATVVGERGVYTSHIRDESDYSIGLLSAIDEVIQVARGAGTRGIVTHIKALGPHVWGYSAQAIALIESARSQGVDVWADQYPYEASATSLTALVSRPLLAGDSLRIRIAEQPEALYADIAENLERRGGADRIQFRRFTPDPSIEGATLADVARARNVDPVQAAMQLMTAGNAGIVSHNMASADVEAFMARPWVMTSSDGGLVAMGEGVPHPRNYGSFPRKLALYVRDRGIISLPAAIRSMTGLPADVMNLESRGYVREGLVADLVLFDPATITDAATYTQPHQLSRGIAYVWVNGEAAIQSGEMAERRFGEVLRLGSD